MPEQRRHSRDYWRALTGEEPTIRMVHRHFFAFMESLLVKLRSGRGRLPTFTFAPECMDTGPLFEQLCRSPRQALFGTFHVGHSDMMGCMLRDFERRISMVRLQVANSHDTDLMERTFSDNVRILWINQPEAFLFALKEALQSGHSLALQCDRAEFTSRTGAFRFLGANREFPMTIYWLSHLFQCPVVFAYTGPERPEGPIEVHTSPIFEPSSTRADTLAQAKEHFQNVLTDLEEHLRRHPCLWLNFSPLNRPVDEEGTTA